MINLQYREIAREVVARIFRDLNDRRGYHADNLEQYILQEFRIALEKIVVGVLEEMDVRVG